MNRPIRLLMTIVAFGIVVSCVSHAPDERFVARTMESISGTPLAYRLFIPDIADTSLKYPLVVFLHGGQGCGDDNISQISASNWSGSHVWVQPEIQNQHKTFVVAPQLPMFKRWDYTSADEMSTYGDLVIELVVELLTTYPVDINRVYVTGQSLGGWGAWDLAAKQSDLFAAAIPVCGGGNPDRASSMKDVAVWAFHGARDGDVDVERSREMVNALKEAGANVEYTEYRFSGHRIWDKAYTEDGLAEWLFAQRKQRQE